MEYNSPLGSVKEQTLISILNLAPDSDVLEVGCGNGKFLSKVLETYQAKGLGVDLSEALIIQAISHACQSLKQSRFKYLAQDITTLEIQPNTYDLIICNGSSHAFGSGRQAYKNTLSQSYSFLKSGGLLLVGEGYWKKEPEQEYLDFIGEPVGVYNDFKGNIEQAAENGFNVLYATSSSQDEWDNFEWSHRLKNKLQLIQQPENSELKTKQSHINKWLKGYLKWGRDTMGYGFYLFEKD